MKKIKKYRGLILSLLLAIVTVFVIHQYISAIENQYNNETVEDQAEKGQVVVASQNISAGKVLTSEHLELKTVSKGEIHSEAVLDKDEVIGEVLVQDMVEDEVLLAQKLLPEHEVNRLSHAVPDNKRAISVSVNEVSGVSGFIQAGDRIDVLATLFDQDDQQDQEQDETKTEMILEDLKVLAAGHKVLYTNQELVQEVSTVTLAVTPNEAVTLTDAGEEGVIRLLLRPIVDDE